MELSDTKPDAAQVAVWRSRARADLVARRMAVSAEQRRVWSTSMTGHIESAFPLLARMTIAFCWPYKGEFDARFAIRHFRLQGASAALPVVTAKAQPLQFRKWWPGAPMKRGVLGIPFPEDTPVVIPQAVLVPANGFDAHGYRLGYGGGYFDYTLAALQPRPLVIAVSFELARLPTIYPQPYDIAMDFVVTEAGIHAVLDQRLTPVDAAQCQARTRELCQERGLVRSSEAGEERLSSPTCYAAEFPEYFGKTDAD